MSEQPVALRDVVAGTALAGATAAIGWTALGIDFVRSMVHSLAIGRSWPQALFLYFHFFTVITNVGIASLMSLTALRLAARRPLPTTPVYGAALVYILVTCATYELMLRNQWRPQNLQFVTDIVIHDVVPALTLLFWLGFAPREGARWRDALWTLVYPAAYFMMTLIAGAAGEGYPYSFFDVDKLGMTSVLVTAAVFLAIFYGLSLVTIALSKKWASPARPLIKDDRSQVV